MLAVFQQHKTHKKARPPVTLLAINPASIAPGCIVPDPNPARLPPQAQADWLHGFAKLRHHRFRPHSATAPIEPEQPVPGACVFVAGYRILA
jgi:hypothetical protein